MLVVIGAEAVGDETLERLPDRLVGWQLEHKLCGRVELDDALVLVDRDDRIHRGRHNGRQPFVAVCQGARIINITGRHRIDSLLAVIVIYSTRKLTYIEKVLRGKQLFWLQMHESTQL
jgi:hypothetical protein